MPRRDASASEERIIDELDGTLPGEIDRRKFLQGTAGAMGTAMLAGCTDLLGGSGDETNFTTPWHFEPSWGTSHVADREGYWDDEGVNVSAEVGSGSDTEASNIGIGNTPMGLSSMSTALSVYPETEDTEALDMNIVAMGKGRPLLSLIWRTDEVEDRTDIAGKDVLLASGFAATTWDMYPNLVDVDPDEVNAEEGTEEVGPASLANNEYQAIWGSIDLLPEYRAEADVELDVEPLTAFGAYYGFPIWVNSGWYEDREDNVEFVADVITGYFNAMKWVLLNQDDYIDFLQEEDSNLQTWDEDQLNGQYQALAAQAVTLDMKDEGLGYFTEDGVQTHLDAAEGALVDDGSLPSASELVEREPWEESEKVTFDDDEWDQVAENAGEFWDLFEEAESGN